MRAMLRLLVVLVLLVPAAGADLSVPGDEQSRKAIAHARAVREDPRWPWNPETVLAGDMNCDGVDDYCVSACADSCLFLAVVLGPPADSSRVSIIGFECNPISQYGLGGWPPRLRLEALTYDLTHGLEHPVRGLRFSPKCNGILIIAGQIDPFHVFWSDEDDQLSWWRL